jgi:hypothetical protein
MKKVSMVVLVGLLVAAFSAPALAWEFSMKGEFEYQFRYISRTGANDLFGNADVAQGPLGAGIPTTIGLAGPNGGAVLVEGHSTKGADAAYTLQRMYLYPQIRLNKALRWRGVYSLSGNLNGYITQPFGRPSFADGAHYAGWYFADSRAIAGENQAMTLGVWHDSWVTAQIPWGIIAFGRRPSQWGTGWSTLAREDIHSRSVAVVAPYGPFAFIWSQYLHDSGEDTDPNASVGPSGNRNFTAPSATDQNQNRYWNNAFAVRYNAGNISTGTLSRIAAYSNVHGAPYAAGTSVTNEQTQSFAAAFINGLHNNVGPWPVVGDVWFLMQVSYFQYNNGRFFFNAEYDFQYADGTRNGGRPVSGRTQAWMLEFGTVIGPTKLSLAHFLRTGHDRRGGQLAVAAPLGTVGAAQAYDTWAFFLVFGGGDQCVEPYQWLMGYYGAGNNGYDVTGYPIFSDFVGYAARLDYAVAANLNLFGSFMWAERQSKTATQVAAFGGGGPRATTAGLQNVPNVPDTYLGWEMDLGVDWKLLEGMTFSALFAYWQPGDWFKYAYVDQSSLVTTTVGGIAANYNPARSIDPLIAFKGSMIVEF